MQKQLTNTCIKHRLANNMILDLLPLTEFMMIVGNEIYILKMIKNLQFNEIVL